MPEVITTCSASGDTVPAPWTAWMGVSTSAEHGWVVVAPLRGLGADAMKSAALSSPSMQPPPRRAAAVVLLSVGAA